MEMPFIWWAGFLALVGVLLAFDLGVLQRKTHEIEAKEALLLSAFYMFLAACFAAFVFYTQGEKKGYEFVTGYIIEETLSLDNIFVFVLIFGHFGVPKLYQHRVLLWGVLGAIVLRGLLIGTGSLLINAFAPVIYLFGAFLIVTGIKMLFSSGAEVDMDDNAVLRFCRKRLRVTEEYHGTRFFIRRDGKRWATPLFLVLILIELTDVVFALDSIPAIFAVTDDTFIIFTSNIFAILGLRSLYFALAVVIHRFEYLKYGLATILSLIGVKMILNHHYHREIISTELSLGITVGLIALSIVVSLLKTRNQPPHATLDASGWHAPEDER